MQKIKKVNLEKQIMEQVKSGRVVMKPKWYFIAGSILSVFSFSVLTIASIFLINIILFLLRPHGPMGQLKFEMMVSRFPWWIPVVAVAGLFVGVWLLKQYDFSYKKNFNLIIIGFIASVLVAGFLINSLGLNEFWLKRGGTMKRFYQNIERQENVNIEGKVKGVRYEGRNYK